MNREKLQIEAFFWLVVIGLGVLIAAAPPYVEMTHLAGRSTIENVPDPVPEPYPIRSKFSDLANYPVVSHKRTMEGDKHLCRPEDKAIFALLSKYKNGDDLYRITKKVFIDSYDPVNPLVDRMVFICRDHEYSVNPGIRSSDELLALSLYHELMHGVQCDAGRLASEVEREPCGQEAEAFADQVRFLVALEKRNMLPSKTSKDDTGEAGLVVQTLEAWKALSLGEEEFCKWYKRSKSGKGL